MTHAHASTKTPRAIDPRSGCSDFSSQDMATPGRAARCSVRKLASLCPDNFELLRLARLAIELGWLFGSDFIPNRRSSRAAENLIRALDCLTAVGLDDVDAQVFECEASGWLNDLIDGVARGFGEFEARFSIDCTVTFVGEPAEVSHALLRVDHRRNVRRRRLHANLPRYCIEVRSTGKKFDCWSLKCALHVLHQAKFVAIETFCFEAQARCDERRGGGA